MKVIVRSAISECELDAPPKTTAREVFNLMSKNLLVVENWYFGLMYRGPNNEQVWVDGSKKSLKLLKNVAEKLNYKVKYYPEDVGDELIERSTIELFFAQVRNAIFKDEIYCPADTCALLASYALQAKYGDYYDGAENEKKEIKNQKLIPQRVLKQYQMDNGVWEESVVNMWKKHKHLDDDDAMMEYLKLVQNLEMYGVSYFDIKNRKGTELLLGVNALGLNIYKPEDRLNPQIAFPWSEIKNLKFKDRKFTIKPVGKLAQDFVFFTSDPRTSKYILNLGIGNHALYVKRRKPEAPEITRMKEKAKELKRQRQLQKDKLNNERAAREEVEKREAEYKTLIRNMQQEMERHQNSLQEAQDTIAKLREQLEDLQRAKAQLEQQQRELREMMENLERSKNLEAEERLRLEEEIRAKQLEVQRIHDEVALKDAETKRLQDEIETKKREEEERQARIAEEQRQKELEEALAREREEKLNEKELEAMPEGTNDELPELAQVNDQLREQLKILKDKLDETRNQEMDTELDRIHRINLREGRDKYKTLSDIRRGNTVRRVEMFENM